MNEHIKTKEKAVEDIKDLIREALRYCKHRTQPEYMRETAEEVEAYIESFTSNQSES